MQFQDSCFWYGDVIPGSGASADENRSPRDDNPEES